MREKLWTLRPTHICLVMCNCGGKRENRPEGMYAKNKLSTLNLRKTEEFCLLAYNIVSPMENMSPQEYKKLSRLLILTEYKALQPRRSDHR